MPIAHATHTPGLEDLAEEAHHHRRILRKLADVGTELAEAVHAEAKTRPLAATAPKRALTIADYARTYENLASGIRRAILLARELAKPHPAQRAPADQRITARAQILRAVEDKIHRHAPDQASNDLQRERNERLDSADLARDLAFRPIADLIIEIARDPGLESTPNSDPRQRRKPRAAAQPVSPHANTAQPASHPCAPPARRA